MSLSPNPFSTAIESAQSLAASATNQAESALNSINFGETKAALEGTVNRLSGGIGSSLNGLSGPSLPSMGGVTSALSGIGNPIQSAVGGIANAASTIGQSINSFGLGGALGSLGGIASAISSAAGQLNNVLSLFRGKNIPSGADLFSARGEAITLAPGSGEDWRVRINCNFGLFGSAFQRLQETNGVVWPFTPKITIATKANYTTIDPVHNNYPFQAYKNSQIDDITISGEFCCETEKDASYWLAATTFFKSATKMWFGQGPNTGNPPVICQLNGYGPGVFNQVPVIIKSFQVDLPDDVNYIKCSSSGNTRGSTWVPVLSTVTVVVSPIYNRQKLRQFSLEQYAKGQALGYM